ncbi:hypothetical protein [Curtobacterium sp. SORGH_AS_0776]|uniref:hypothetical protein n=1 Tax=Curtobacterium sp. SORGH_AS_0776 TaxID=3041798 RepID=UPI002864DE2C|nr:hypothetical protein [Curtobacterium sp. SORGH_AS_0776]MDR6170355.1 hypothetical protein [Curtobacterium sp. SORGH_AS_0776]
MQHETTPPFRFRTPPGWPTPSAEWVELHQAAEPAPGWSPAPGIPPAPVDWRFWAPVPRSFRGFVPAAARRLRVAQWIGLVVALLALAAVSVVAALGGLAVVGLLPLVAGIAVLVVCSARAGELADRTAASIRDDAAVWRRTEVPARARAAFPELDQDAAVAAWESAAWGMPTVRPFAVAADAAPERSPLRHRTRTVVAVTAGAAALLLVVGATTAVDPVVRALQSNGQTLAYGLQDTAPDGSVPDDSGPDDDAPDQDAPDAGDQAPWTSDDGTVTASFIGDDETWQATCGAIDFADGCWAWQIDSECDGPARVTVGFSATEGGDDVRTDSRTVVLTSGRPLVLTEQGSEEWGGIRDVTCSTAPEHAVALTRSPLDSDAEDADGSWPDGCVDYGCAGWEVTPEASCDSATVQFSVDEEVATLPGPHDLVVATALRAGEPVDVWAGGAWLPDDDATISQVTCG